MTGYTALPRSGCLFTINTAQSKLKDYQPLFQLKWGSRVALARTTALKLSEPKLS